MTLDFNDHLRLLGAATTTFDQTLAGVPADRPVVGCPGWTTTDLRDHTAEVLAFWRCQLDVADADAAEPTIAPDLATEAARPVAELGPELVSALASAGPDAPCWNWSGVNLRAGWVARRMANELGVHGADAAATAGTMPEVPAELAADGIDELLDVFLDAPPEARTGQPPILALETPDHQWMIRVGDEGVWRQADPSDPATTTLRGSASALVLRLWGRSSEVTVEGPTTALDRWAALFQLD